MTINEIEVNGVKYVPKELARQLIGIDLMKPVDLSQMNIFSVSVDSSFEEGRESLYCGLDNDKSISESW